MGSSLISMLVHFTAKGDVIMSDKDDKTEDQVEDQKINEDLDAPLDVSDAVETSTEESEADTNEKKDDEEVESDTDSEDSKEDESDDDSKEEEDKDEDDSKEEEEADKSTETEEDKKIAARNAFRRRQEVRQQVSQQLDKRYGPETKEQLIANGMSPEQAEIAQLNSNIEHERRRSAIIELNASLTADAQDIIEDYKVFDPKSDQFDEKFRDMVNRQWTTQSNYEVDEDGTVLRADIPMYSHYSEAAKMYNRGGKQGETKGKKQAVEMLSRSEKPATGSNQTKADEDDPFLVGFDKGA